VQYQPFALRVGPEVDADERRVARDIDRGHPGELDGGRGSRIGRGVTGGADSSPRAADRLLGL
jgi:hypothetical protein